MEEWTRGERCEIIETYRQAESREVVETYIRPLPGHPAAKRPVLPRKRRGRRGLWVFWRWLRRRWL